MDNDLGDLPPLVTEQYTLYPLFVVHGYDINSRALGQAHQAGGFFLFKGVAAFVPGRGGTSQL